MKRSHLACIFALLLSALAAFAQTSQGTLGGTVTDPSGAALPGANVTAKNRTGADQRTVKTGSNGEYRIDAITPSTYDVTVEANGFQTQKIQGVQVGASVATSLNAKLELGNVSQSVTVESTTALVQTESGEISHSISAREVTFLPNPTQNPIDLVLTEPGVVTVASRDSMTNGESFSVNGMRPRSNNFLIDGFDNNDYGITGQALQPSNLEAVKEVVLMSNSYMPEFGRGGASITNVLYKNGTNEFHGALWERYSAAGLNAIPVEQKNQGLTSNPNFVHNLFGFDIGGPVVKNKLFLFGTSQWDRENEDATGAQLQSIPTAAGVGLLNAIGSSNAKILVDSLGGVAAPLATGTVDAGDRPGCGSPCLIPVGPLIRTIKATSRAHEWVLRGDWTPREKDTISVRYIDAFSSFSPDLFANATALPTQDTEQSGPSRNTGAVWTHTFSPTVVNEARFTAQQIDFGFRPLSSTTSNPLFSLPNLTLSELDSTYGGLDPTWPQGRGHDTYEYQDGLSWSFGAHSVKVGTDIVHLSINDLIPFNSRGSVDYTQGGDCLSGGVTTSCSSLANFLDGFTGPGGQVGRSIGSASLTYPDTIQAYYFQDSWKLRRNLTINYGVRYEYFGTPLNVLPYPTVLPGAGALTQGVTERVKQQRDTNNFGPRFGFAYSADQKTVIRGGFGAFYDFLFANIMDNTASSTPNTLGGLLVAPDDGRGLTNPFGLVSDVTASVSPFATVSSVTSNIVNPLTYQWNLDLERQLPGNLLVDIAYVGTRGERLYVNRHLNPAIDGDRIDPDRGAITARTNSGDSIYHGLDVKVERRFSHGLMVRGAYTWSKSIDNISDVFVTSGQSSYAQDLFNQAGERGLSAFDRRHRAVISFDYQMPSWRMQSAIARAVTWPVRDWQVGGVLSWQSGAPETISLLGFDQNGDLSASNDRPDLGNPHAAINYSAACLATGSGCISGIGQLNEDGSLVDWNSGAPGTASDFRYIVVPGSNGNLGRNTFVNPGRQDYNLALTRIIKTPWEGKQFELKAEALNVFNHPNAGGGTTQDGSSVLGVNGNVNSSAFMNKDITYEGGRGLYLWLKFRF